MKEVLLNGKVYNDHEIDCGECGEPMRLLSSRDGRKLFYGCAAWRDTRCEGSHPARSDGSPIGIPVDEETRKARRSARFLLSQLWEGPYASMGQGEAYSWAAERLKVKKVSFGRLSKSDCKSLIWAILSEYPAVKGAGGWG